MRQGYAVVKKGNTTLRYKIKLNLVSRSSLSTDIHDMIHHRVASLDVHVKKPLYGQRCHVSKHKVKGFKPN